jgi:hypothetical protein
MAKKTVAASSAENNTNNLTPDPASVIPRMTLKEQGFIGLKTSNGYVIQEPNRAFRYPAMILVVDEMRLCPSVAAPLNAYRLLMSQAEWDVKPPSGATEQQIERANFIKSCMDDMDHSWKVTSNNWFDYLEYGSHVSEKVFRRRLTSNGSKYNDGLVGIRKLAPRARASLERWQFSEDGRDLIGVEQTLRYMDKSYLYTANLDDRGLIPIPREKFLLFVCDNQLDNPEGNSILKNVYLSYKQLILLQDQELLSIAKNIQGVLKITAPPRYFDPSASDSDKAVLAGFSTTIQNYGNGTLPGILAPAMADPESGQAMFAYELLESKGQSQNVGETIKRLQGDILTALSCDILKMGVDTAGSFNTQDGDSNILILSVARRLQEQVDVLNHDLIPHLFRLNGWTDTELPKFIIKSTSSTSLDEFSSFIQRVSAVGALEYDRGVLNRIREVAGFDTKPVDEPIDIANLSTTLTGKQSSSGQGMAVGVGGVNGGTSTASVSAGDKSIANNANNA